MRNLGAALAADLTFLAICWRVRRSDGVALGFTTHDRPLVIAGLRYESAPGMVPSAIVCSDDLDIDTMDIGGALTTDAMSGDDLAAGRFDDAAIDVFMVDWRDPDGGTQSLAQGRIGAVEAGLDADSGFVASVRGPTSVFAATAVESYSPECRADLGDHRCRVAMRGRSTRAIVDRVDGLMVTLIQANFTMTDFTDGRLRVLDGPLAGLVRSIVSVIGDGLLLDQPIDLTSGVRLRLWQGCDKRLATCAARFANAANFHGEPHVPGGDILTRFGGV